MNSITYRSASHNDLDQLHDLHIASYSEFQTLLPQSGWTTLSANLNNKQKIKDVFYHSRAFVAEVGGTIVGMAFLVSSGNPTAIYPAHWSYIRMVGVHPAYRGRAIGKELTIMCIEEARKNGEKFIGLHTSEIMNAARHVYEGLGFTIEKEIDKIFGVRYWLYKMDL